MASNWSRVFLDDSSVVFGVYHSKLSLFMWWALGTNSTRFSKYSTNSLIFIRKLMKQHPEETSTIQWKQVSDMDNWPWKSIKTAMEFPCFSHKKQPGPGANPAPHGTKLGTPNPGWWLLPAAGRSGEAIGVERWGKHQHFTMIFCSPVRFTYGNSSMKRSWE